MRPRSPSRSTSGGRPATATSASLSSGASANPHAAAGNGSSPPAALAQRRSRLKPDDPARVATTPVKARPVRWAQASPADDSATLALTRWGSGSGSGRGSGAGGRPGRGGGPPRGGAGRFGPAGDRGGGGGGAPGLGLRA